jgi:hypothetical protein
VVRASPNDGQDHRGSTSNDQDVTDQIHLLDPGAQVILGSLDIQERPHETESEQAEGKVEKEQPLPLFCERASDERSDGASECPNATDDTGKDASLGEGEHIGNDYDVTVKGRMVSDVYGGN